MDARERQEMPFEVEFSDHFTILFDNLTEAEKDLIHDFAMHCVRSGGTKGFIGKVAMTDNVPAGDPDRARKIWFAKHYHLYHVHIGFRSWRPSRNPLAAYRTSEWVVHFMSISREKIRLIDYDFHDPMHMPKKFMFHKT